MYATSRHPLLDHVSDKLYPWLELSEAKPSFPSFAEDNSDSPLTDIWQGWFLLKHNTNQN
jgi:hypothetical protein